MEKENKKEKTEKEDIKEVVKEVVKEERKSHVWLITILVICLMAVCGLFGWLAGASYFAFNKNAPKQETKEEEKEETKKEETTTAEEKHLTEAEVGSYLEIAQDMTTSFASKYPVLISNISNQEILWFLWKAWWKTPREEGQVFSKDDLDNRAAYYFGKDYQYTVESIDCNAGDGTFLEYDASTKKFTKVGTHGHGGGASIRSSINFEDAIEEGDTLTLKTRILYGGSCGDTCGPITDYYATTPFNTSIYKVNEDCYFKSNCDDYDEVYPKVKDQLPITSFIFKKQSDGNFGLTKVEVE